MDARISNSDSHPRSKCVSNYKCDDSEYIWYLENIHCARPHWDNRRVIRKYEKRLATKKLHHLETSPHPTLQDIRPVNGSNDEICLDDIKKINDEDAEMNGDECEDEDGDGDKDNKAEYGFAKSMLVNLVDVAIGNRDRFRVLGNKPGVVHYLGNVELSNEKLIEIGAG
ncbi:hypothetical protein RFI_04753 [Reticulomyxa filosa]|uniref:Uncharacterized protein n=1 Tax=Reticulomyxa filosa TaxID=46433 RepID=X6P2M2_RETFI|nr:hypothetical protein RFI_04753 [Reticulomyxa filosa]|eukprot:ETO32363.1 hypothetical protein RFI_04753 [Reticulomyxa filosa]